MDIFYIQNILMAIALMIVSTSQESTDVGVKVSTPYLRVFRSPDINGKSNSGGSYTDNTKNLNTASAHDNPNYYVGNDYSDSYSGHNAGSQDNPEAVNFNRGYSDYGNNYHSMPPHDYGINNFNNYPSHTSDNGGYSDYNSGYNNDFNHFTPNTVNNYDVKEDISNDYGGTGKKATSYQSFTLHSHKTVPVTPQHSPQYSDVGAYKYNY